MRISCVVNFAEKPIKNLPYYNLLMKQMTLGVPYEKSPDVWVGESAALCTGGEGIISKICEGYQFVIAFSGELVEKDELINELSALGYRFTTGSCAELALNAYIHYGDKSLEKLAGAFSYVIYDTMRRQVFAASDSDASLPLFYSECKSAAIISSHIKGILAYPGKTARISKEALCGMLTGSAFANVFEGVRMLPPASILKIKESGTVLKEYKPKPSQPLTCGAKENAAVLLLGAQDEALYERIARERAAACNGIYTYSHAAMPTVCAKYPTVHTQLDFDEQALMSGLCESVSACGVPVLSQTDFLLAPIFSRIPKCGFRVFLSKEKAENMRQIFLESEILHSAVAESVSGATDADFGGIINATAQIAERVGALVKTVEVPESLPGADYEVCDREILKRLRHILLGIIAEDTAPILAFFDKSALLGVCERGFAFPISTRAEASLIAYIIKLNIWLLKYRPRLI